MKKILVFGTGNEYKNYKKWLQTAEIAALIDNDEKKQGTVVDNLPVIAPKDCASYSVDCVYIMSSRYVRKMTEQLTKLGIPEEKIYYLFDLADLGMKYKAPVCRIPVREKAAKKIALLSDNLQLSGAQFALLNAAILLKKNGYFVMMASPTPGKLQSYISDEGIPLIIDERLRTGKIQDAEWLKDFDLVVVNTVLNYHLLLNRDTNIPVIWWLHETEYFYSLVMEHKIRMINPKNLNIYAVSSLAKRPLLEIRDDFSIEDLFVYVKEEFHQEEKIRKDNGKIVFAVIGVVCELKGQDLLLKVLDVLSEDENKQIEVWFIGREDEEFIREYGEVIEEHSNVRKFGELGKSDLRKLYREIDVVVCSSRSENLCMAVLEGAQQSIVPIISTAAAVSDYFKDGWDGIIFQSENEAELTEKIRWCLRNSDKLPEMGQRARKVYNTNFSEAIFEYNLLQAVGKVFEYV